MKRTVVIGASPNPSRYAYLAVSRLARAGHEVVALGKSAGMIGEIPVLTTRPVLTDIDTVSLYLNAVNQRDWYDYILALHPKRILFNPGTENPELAEMAAGAGIETEAACTLVLLSTGAF